MRGLYYALCVLLLGLALPLRAQESTLGGFSFLRLETSARVSALGGVFPDWLPEDVSAVFLNPATLNASMHRQLSLSYLNHLDGIHAGTIVLGWQVPRLGMMAFGLRYVSYGTMEEADEQGNRLGTFGASDGGFFVAMARRVWGRLRVGVQVGGVFSHIASYQATALTVEGGVSYIWPEQFAAFSASFHHAGVVLQSLGAVKDRLPTDIRVGVSKRLAHLPLVLGLSVYDLANVRGKDATLWRHMVMSGEFRFSPAFQLRFGYNPRRHEALKIKSRLDMAGVSVGFGLRIRRFTFDYAYVSWSSLGALHHFTLRSQL